MELLQVAACPTTELSYTNKAILNPQDKFAQFEHIAVRYPKTNEAFVFSVVSSPNVELGKIAFNAPGRKWASLLLASNIEAAPYNFEPRSQCLNTITFYTDFASRQNAPVAIDFDTNDMSRQFSQQFYSQALTVGQLFGFAYMVNGRKVVFELKVKELKALTMEQSQADTGTSNVEIGLTTANTIVMFERAQGSDVRLVGDLTGRVAAPKIFSQNWDFASMGVGGLSEEFNKMFVLAFASRLLPPQFAEAMGTEHVRGILLHGPPGTGKTLIARQIGKMLLSREPKVVNGPEVLNKYVGESEANIRRLFKEAAEEEAKAGINSGLHVIIFDEIDALCKARSGSASSSGIGDNVVNQLLSMIDGVNALHNVLLIGMTNRRDLIDEALLRPGRLELSIEIGLPNKQGRLEIFQIHTKKMRDMNVLDPSVSLEHLAEVTKNFTGAEIAGLIRAARSLAISRVIKPELGCEFDQEMLKTIRVDIHDFENAMEHDIKPALGASEDQLKMLNQPIIQWDPAIEFIQSQMHNIVKQLASQDGEVNRPHHVLLVGKRGAGLTTLAASMAAESNFPFVRVYQALEDASESGQVLQMKKLFEDASRSELSLIVIDDLDMALDYCHIGPRFSNPLRKVLIKSLDKQLPKKRRMLVVCTCSDQQSLEDMRVHDVFREIIEVPSLTRPEQVEAVLRDMRETGGTSFTVEQGEELVEALRSVPFEMGIKRLKCLLEMVDTDPSQRVRMFMQRMHRLKLVIRSYRLVQDFNF